MTEATFLFDVVLRNFELAQLGLVWLALRDLMRGELRLGSGKSRGFGRARGDLASCDVAYVGPRPEDEAPALLGAGHVWRGAAAYGFPPEDAIDVEGASYERIGIWTHLRAGGPGLPWDAIERRAVAALEAYVPTPAALRARQPGVSEIGTRGTSSPAGLRRVESAPRSRVAATTRPVRGLETAPSQGEVSGQSASGPERAVPEGAEPERAEPERAEPEQVQSEAVVGHAGLEERDQSGPEPPESEGPPEQ